MCLVSCIFPDDTKASDAAKWRRRNIFCLLKLDKDWSLNSPIQICIWNLRGSETFLKLGWKLFCSSASPSMRRAWLSRVNHHPPGQLESNVKLLTRVLAVTGSRFLNLFRFRRRRDFLVLLWKTVKPAQKCQSTRNQCQKILSWETNFLGGVEKIFGEFSIFRRFNFTQPSPKDGKARIVNSNV